MAKRKTHEEFMVDFLQNGNQNIIIVGEYINDKTKILVKCKIDGYEWYAYPSNLLRGKGCPVCVGKIVVPEINSVSVLRPDLVKYFKNKNEAFNITVKSNRKIDLICPDCGKDKSMYMYDLSEKGFVCSECGPSISYPNRLIRSFIKQFKHNIDYVCYEWSADWTNRQRYDVYFIKDKQEYVIEMQGGQHYALAWDMNISVEEKINNDLKKEKLAIAHGIVPIIIDARVSNFDFIIKNIYNSALGIIFDLSAFDIYQCKCDAAKNIVKEICKKYMDDPDISIKALSEFYNIHTSTVVKYLKQGSEFGWCNYDPKVSECLSKIRQGKSVKVYNENKVLIHEFYAILQCAREMSKIYNIHFSRKSISKVCNGMQKSYHNFYFEYA